MVDLDSIQSGSSKLAQNEAQWRAHYRNLVDPSTEEFGLGDYVGDILASPFRGVEGALHGIWNLFDALEGTVGLDLIGEATEDHRLLGKSQTVVGGFGEGLTQFMLAFVPIAGWMSRGAKIAKVGVPGLKALSAGGKAARAAPFRTAMTRDAIAGMMADFTVYDGHEKRLANMLQEFGGFDDPVTNWLAADEDDSELWGRVKVMAEGIPLGVSIDLVVHALRGMKKARGVRDGGGSAGDIEDVLREHWKGREDELVDQMQESYTRRQQKAQPEEPKAKELFQETEEGSGVKEWTDDSGHTHQMRYDVPQGKKKKQYLDENGDVIKSGASEEEAARTLLRRADGGDGGGTARGLPDEPMWSDDWVQRLKATVAARREGAKTVTFADGTTKELSWQNINPRDFENDPFGLIERAIKDNDINLATSTADVATYARSIGEMYKEAWPAQADPKKIDELLEESGADIRDMLKLQEGDDLPEGVMLLNMEGLKDLDLAHQFNIRLLSWRTTLHLYADGLQKAVYDFLRAPLATRDEMLARAVLARDRTLIALRTAKGLEAVAGRAMRSMQIPFQGYSSLLESLQRSGGDKQFEKWAKQVSEMGTLTGGDRAALLDAARRGEQTRLVDVTMEWWLNAVLGGGKTMAINATSGIFMNIWRPLERMLGAAMRLNLPQVRSAVNELTYLLTAGRDALRPMAETWKSGQPTLLAGGKLPFRSHMTKRGWDEALEGWEVPMTRTQVKDIPGVKQAINPSMDTVYGRMLRGFFNFHRYPSRVLTTTDEWAKQTAYNVHARSLLTDYYMRQGLNPDRAIKRASEEVAKLTENHQRLSKELLIKRYADQLAKEGTIPEADIPREAFQMAEDHWKSDDGILQRLVAADAARVADETTFTSTIDWNGTTAERLTAKVTGALNSSPFFKFFVPFIRTPFNIMRWARDRTVDPAIGVVRLLGNSNLRRAVGARGTDAGISLVKTEEVKNRFLREIIGDIDLQGVDPTSPMAKVILARRKEEALSRFMVGVSMFGLFSHYAFTGRLTGAGPTDKEQRRLLMQAGWRPYSVKVGDSYYEYRRLDPVATLLGIAADVANYGRYTYDEEDENLETVVTAVAVAFANNVTNKTYMMGLKNLVNIMEQPEVSFTSAAGNILAGIVPAGWRDAGRVVAGDEVAREVRGLTDKLVNRLPYMGDNFDKVRNFMGEEVRQIQSWGPGEGVWQRIANVSVPVAYSEVTDNKVAIELARLQHGFSPPKRKIHGVNTLEFQNDQGQSAYDRMLQLRGEVRIGGKNLRGALLRLMESPAYKRMAIDPPGELTSPRIQAINRVVQRYHRSAMRKMLREYPELATTLREARRAKRESKFGILQELGR